LVIIIGVARRYEWLLFDADGTLFDYERAEQSALAEAFRQAGLAYEPGYLEQYQQINNALWQALERKEITPAALKVVRFERLLQRIGAGGSGEEFGEIYLQCLAICSELIAGAGELLETLGTDYRLAIVTNGLQAVQRGRLSRSAIGHHISELIISEEIGHAKPAREFFEITLARLGHPSKERVLMIGDNWNSDICGAAGFGIDTCWFNPSRQPRPATPAISHEVQSLAQLGTWLAEIPA
jgi:2-haloacid dehalogenase